MAVYNLLLFMLVFSHTFGTQKMQEKDRYILIHQVMSRELENQNIREVAEGLIYFVLTPMQ